MATLGGLVEAVEETKTFVSQLRNKGLTDNDIASLFVGSAVGVLVEKIELDDAEIQVKNMVSNNAGVRRENALNSPKYLKWE
jgi:hypothetical protein